MTESSLERIRDTTQRTDFEQTFFKTVDQICGAIRAKDAKAAEQYLRAQLLKITENCLGLPYPNTLNMTVYQFAPFPSGGAGFGQLALCLSNGFQPGSGICKKFTGVPGCKPEDCRGSGHAQPGTYLCAL